MASTSIVARTRDWFHELGEVLFSIPMAIRRTAIFYEAHQESMLPTIRPGDRLVVTPVQYLGAEPFRRGDLVIFESWHEGEAHLLKRVIATPGDEVAISAHVVYVNGEALDEPYAIPPTHGTLPAFRLGDGEYYVLGDNRCNSCDSRRHGALTIDRVVGRVIFRNGPVGRMRWFE